MYEEALVFQRRTFSWRWAARKVLAALVAMFAAVGLGTTISALADRVTWMTPPVVSMFTFANGGQSVLEETGIIRDNLTTLRDVEAEAVAADQRFEDRLQTLEGRVAMLTRATARCERGFAFDTTSGRCTAAPCDVPGSNGNPGPNCACPARGNLTWSGDAWVGSCGHSAIADLTLGHLTGPPHTEQWQLAFNINTDDGNLVDYYNNHFWQDATELGGATDNMANALTHDYKDASVFTTAGVKQILVVVHDEGRLLGWRRWRTIHSHSSLKDYFTSANTCPGSLTEGSSVHVASETVDAEEGGLDDREPLVMNRAGNEGPTTNTDLWFNACGQGDQDCNRFTTGRATDSTNGWGLGGAYMANGRCNGGTYFRADAELHSIEGADWAHGLIGSDCEADRARSSVYPTAGTPAYCTSDLRISGLSYDYAIFVGF